MILFEWDETKAASNWRKHGVTFEDAMSVFNDSNAIFEQDRIRIVDDHSVLVVAHHIEDVEPDEVVRIISARRANRLERKRYGKNREKNTR